MLVAIQVEAAPGKDRRNARRLRSNAMAKIRLLKQPPEMIHVVDISSEGCGFRSKHSLEPGTRVLLNLPGLEVWLATVVWFENGKGGLKFDRALHPAVARQFSTSAARDDRQRSP